MSHLLVDFHSAHPIFAIALFCALHLVASTVSFPGGCTVLNITAGALFGFWGGCAVVYPVTLLGASLVYAFATRLNGPWVERYRSLAAPIHSRLMRHDYLYLVTLRLSPILPFGPLNVTLALLGVPFGLYMLTTAIGIFFDVTVLTSVGAGLASGGREKILAIAFALLLVLFHVIRSLLPKAEVP